MKLRGALLSGWKLGIYAHEKLGVCNRGFGETSGCIRGNFGVLFRGVGVVCALVVFSSFSMCSIFSVFVHFGDFCRGEGTQRRVLFKICLHIPLWCGGVGGLTM